MKWICESFLIVGYVFFPLFIYTCTENYTWSTFCFWFPLFGNLTDELKLCGLEIMQLIVVSLLCICPSVTVRAIKVAVRNVACRKYMNKFCLLKKQFFFNILFLKKTCGRKCLAFQIEEEEKYTIPSYILYYKPWDTDEFWKFPTIQSSNSIFCFILYFFRF